MAHYYYSVFPKKKKNVKWQKYFIEFKLAFDVISKCANYYCI